MAAAVSGLSPVIMTVRMPMARSCCEALLHAALHDVLQMNHAQRAVAVGHGQRRAAGARDAVGDFHEVGGNRAAVLVHEVRSTDSVAPLRKRRPSRSTPLMRV